MTVSGSGKTVSAARVDLNALRFNQVLLVGFVILAFVIGTPVGPWIVVALSASLAIGALSPGNGPFQVFYREVVLRSGLLSPNVVHDDPAQHRFAQIVGAFVAGAAGLLLLLGFDAAGWFLASVVAGLALLNLVFGFCAGCFLYLHLSRFLNRTGVTS